MGIQIADIVTSIYRDGQEARFCCGDAYGQFSSSGKPDIRVDLHARPLPRFKKSQLLMKVNKVWDLYRLPSGYAFSLPYQKLVADCDFRSADFYRAVSSDEHYPLAYPFDQLLMIGLLAKGLGVLTHACGVSYKGRGFLFMGDSGAGKSTLARLLSKQKEMTILSDDRVIIRKFESKYVVYGTPWLGEAQFASSNKAYLENIFFLCHGKTNQLKTVQLSQAVARLFAHSFAAFWDKQGIGFYLDFYSSLISQIPVHELSFRPDASVVSFIQSQIT